MAGDLKLSRLAAKDGKLWLGRIDGGPQIFSAIGAADSSQATGAAKLALSATGLAASADSATSQATITLPATGSTTAPISATGQAQYDNAVFRGPSFSNPSEWREAAKAARIGEVSSWRNTAHAVGRSAIPWREADQVQSADDSPWREMATHQAASDLAWQNATTITTPLDARYHQQAVRQSIVDAIYREAEARHSDALAPWHEQFVRQQKSASPWREGKPRGKSDAMAFGDGRNAGPVAGIPWGTAQRRADFIPIAFVPPIEPPRQPSTRLWLQRRPARDGALWLGRIETPGQIKVPKQRVYYVQNSIRLATYPADQEIACTSLQVSIDVDSYVWSFSTEVAPGAAALVSPTAGEPATLRITINGFHWLVMAESISRSREFGKASLRVSGRGLAARLGNPYSQNASWTNAGAITAQQLAAESLKENGVPIGWDVDWQLTDWLIPAGAQSLQGDRIGAIADIAGAAGGYIQADREAQTLHIKHRYPTIPRDWASAAPDIILPPDIITTESTDWREKPDYNAVYVSGQDGGVLGYVSITGSGGTRVAPTQVNRLITHADAARQKGRAILGDTGRQANVTISLPITNDTGLIAVGNMLRINETGDVWQGLVRRVNVSAAWPKVTQSVELERHYV